MSDGNEILQAIGLNQEELADRVVDNLVDRFYDDRDFNKCLHDKVISTLNSKIDAIANTIIAPMIENMLSNIVIQETNQFGEKKYESVPVSFIEYITARADEYLSEPVDNCGRSKEECAEKRESWDPSRKTRLQHIVNGRIRGDIAEVSQKFIKGLTPALHEGVKSITTQMINNFSESVIRGIDDASWRNIR